MAGLSLNIAALPPAPLIVCGMHRSGTSLVSSVLQSLGFFMGKDLDPNNESISFMNINRTILQMAHAFWDHPTPMRELMREQDARDEAREHLRERLASDAFAKRYLGYPTTNSLLLRLKSVILSQLDDAGPGSDLPTHWGWKDPRNTLTFPLWLEAFTDARLLFIVRNGLAVANSLHHRELEQKERRVSLRKGFVSLRCRNRSEAFHLWEEYNRYFIEFGLSCFPETILQVRYEDLLNEPESTIEAIAKFAKLPVDESRISKATALLRPSDKKTIQQDFEHEKLESLAATSDVMQYFGYCPKS
jgi:hypothetical protein